MEDSNEKTVLVPGDVGNDTVIIDEGGLGVGTIVLLVILVLILLGGIATGIYFLVRTVKKKKAKKAAQAVPQVQQPGQAAPPVTPASAPGGYVAPQTKKLPWFFRFLVPKKKGTTFKVPARSSPVQIQTPQGPPRGPPLEILPPQAPQAPPQAPGAG